MPSLHKCTICGKSGKDRGNLRKHVENIHFPGSFSYPCKHCKHEFSTRNTLNMHISKDHRNKWFGPWLSLHLHITANTVKIPSLLEITRKIAALRPAFFYLLRAQFCAFLAKQFVAKKQFWRKKVSGRRKKILTEKNYGGIKCLAVKEKKNNFDRW